jgi:hypothetical protein
MKFRFVICAIILAATGCSHSPSAAQNTPAPNSENALKGKRVIAARFKSGAATDHTLCKHDADLRELTVVPKGVGCELEYLSEKQTKMIASAEHHKEVCKQVLQKVRGHLEEAGFICSQ